MDKSEFERRMDAFIVTCKDAGLKLTAQRIEVFKEIAGCEDHPDAESLFKRVRQRLPTISLDTVYRTLWWLNELGMITTLGPTQDRARFDANLACHHHFICTQCGLTRDFYSDELDKLKLPELATSLGAITNARVEIKGVCHACAALQRSNDR